MIRDCNQNCIICSNPTNEKTLSLKEAKEKIDELKVQGYAGVILTGGEPTLYAHLPALIGYAIKKKISPRIVTNGQKIADKKYLQTLHAAGLRHLHLSVFSLQEKVQVRISRYPLSFQNIKKALSNLKEIGDIAVDINTAINKYNADHLSKTVAWLVQEYPFIKHFVFNNLDPYMNRVSENPGVVPNFNDFELELHRALKYLEKNGKTFRVERVPLCYLTDFEYVSTETRKIVKEESRTVCFLDDKGTITQDDWFYKKTADCQKCSLKKICAGLYAQGGFYKESELYAVFIDPQKIIEKIKKD